MWISDKDKFIQIDFVVAPNAGRNLIVGEYNGRLKVKIHSPPVEGAANFELIQFVSEILDTPKKNIQIIKGETSRQKSLAIVGLGFSEVQQKLQAAVGVTFK